MSTPSKANLSVIHPRSSGFPINVLHSSARTKSFEEHLHKTRGSVALVQDPCNWGSGIQADGRSGEPRSGGGLLEPD